MVVQTTQRMSRGEVLSAIEAALEQVRGDSNNNVSAAPIREAMRGEYFFADLTRGVPVVGLRMGAGEDGTRTAIVYSEGRALLGTQHYRMVKNIISDPDYGFSVTEVNHGYDDEHRRRAVA